MACTRTSYNPDLDKSTVQSRDISIPSRGALCLFRPVQSGPVKSRDISIPSRGVPCFFSPVQSRPANPVVSESCPVQSRKISIPSQFSRSIPWWFNPVLYRPVLLKPRLIPSRGIPGYLGTAGSRPETKIRSRGKPWNIVLKIPW